MKIIKDRKINYDVKIIYPNLGFVAASFTAFLTILAITNRSAILIEAVNCFALGLPLITGCLFFTRFKRLRRFPKIHLLLFLLTAFAQVIGSFNCLRGIYLCFLDISKTAAESFIIACSIFFVVFSILHKFDLYDEPTENLDKD